MSKLISLLFIVLLSGCKGSLDKQGALDWWMENKSTGLSILNMLKSSPMIERVEPGKKRELIKNHEEMNDQMWEVYRKIENIILNDKKLELVTIHSKNNLIIFRMIVDRYGLSVAGCSLSIIFHSDDKLYKQRRNMVVYSEYLEPNWYLEINGDKECIRHAQ